MHTSHSQLGVGYLAGAFRAKESGPYLALLWHRLDLDYQRTGCILGKKTNQTKKYKALLKSLNHRDEKLYCSSQNHHPRFGYECTAERWFCFGVQPHVYVAFFSALADKGLMVRKLGSALYSRVCLMNAAVG